ncbi:MAG TPA: hypothetical protein VMU63_03625 [Acidimicrobiales bacterium]|nr:hypothetical protein [Acidimicrobiales bacterium]
MTTELAGTSEDVKRADARRSDLLAAAADRFRRFDLRNTWQVAAGSVLVPLGIVIVLLAWYGSAHTPYIQGQIPYLVSGSFIGLGLMVVGGLLYWAHWLYRIYDQADLHHMEQLQRDRQLFDLLEAVLARDPEGVVRARNTGATGSASAIKAESGLVTTATGTNLHRADCPIVARHRAGVRPVSAAEAKGRPPCRICQPAVPA